jgi:hypothetical protein
VTTPNYTYDDETLYVQSVNETQSQLHCVLDSTDEVLGEGCAKVHPELIAGSYRRWPWTSDRRSLPVRSRTLNIIRLRKADTMPAPVSHKDLSATGWLAYRKRHAVAPT